METSFIREDFLLGTKRARDLYHTFAERLPIIDFHCHLPAREIAEDRRFENLTRIWLAGDHYKWRAMRTCGVPERYITGDATDWEKFSRWAEVVPQTLRNPLYHWTHLELKRPFGIDCLLDGSTARQVWERCNAHLQTREFSARGILRQMHVELICTTDDPVDSLEHHMRMLGRRNGDPRMLPAFRADRAMAVEDPGAFRRYVSQLENAAEVKIRSFEEFLEALRRRHEAFHELGCRLSDHGLERMHAVSASAEEIGKIFGRTLDGHCPTPEEVEKFRSAMIYQLSVMDWEKGWVQQFHLGAMRNINSRMMHTLGADTGYDAIGDWEVARSMARFLDRLDAEGRLAKTILYNLSPAQNEVFAAMIGCFQDGTVPGKIQYGAAWWFLDQRDGMTRQIEALSTMGLLSQFVGMITDSRSFLSFPRHEYFRRLLCDILGSDMEKGLVPDDPELVGGMIGDICYRNAARYFGFPSESRGGQS